MSRVLATSKWIDQIVLGGKLCPFAAAVRASPHLRIESPTNSRDAASAVAAVAREANRLRAALAVPKLWGIQTTLLVLGPSSDWETWDDFVRLGWQLQSDAIFAGGHEKEILLVLFHPKAVHSTYGDDLEDAADWSIRSPYPTVHLLRERDVLQAVKSGADVSGIPLLNKARLRKLGIDECRRRLTMCNAL